MNSRARQTNRDRRAVPMSPARSSRRRYVGWVCLVLLLIGTGLVWKLRSPKPDPWTGDSIVTDLGGSSTPVAATKTAVGTAAGTTAAHVEAASRHMERVFDSNKLSGRLLYSKSRDDKFIPDSDAPSGWDLWLRDAAGNERLAHDSVFSAKFSPDGQRIAYTTSGCTLRVEDLLGNKLAEVEGAYLPQWKPDGSAVVFAKVPEGHHLYLPGTLHLATLEPDSGQVRLLTDGRFDDGRPEFAPSGDWILFVSGARNGFASFWRIGAHGGEPAQVTNIGQQAVDHTFVPTPYQKTLWSPDGRWFIYDFKSGEREQIWGLQFTAGGELMRATRIADGLNPSWADDGRTLAFSRRVNGQTESGVATLP